MTFVHTLYSALILLLVVNLSLDVDSPTSISYSYDVKFIRPTLHFACSGDRFFTARVRFRPY